MDVYHKVLVKLYEVTGGRDSQAIDFRELLRELGFLGNYGDILQNMSDQGWVAETLKDNYVKITHWGVKEAKKTLEGGSDGADGLLETKKLVNQTREEVKSLSIMLDEFSEDYSLKRFTPIEGKIGEISNLLAKIKTNL